MRSATAAVAVRVTIPVWTAFWSRNIGRSVITLAWLRSSNPRLALPFPGLPIGWTFLVLVLVVVCSTRLGTGVRGGPLPPTGRHLAASSRVRRPLFPGLPIGWTFLVLVLVVVCSTRLGTGVRGGPLSPTG